MTAGASFLHAKLVRIGAQLGRIPKKGWNDHHKYHYVLEADVVEALRELLAAEKVMLLPQVRSMERDQLPAREPNRAPRYIVHVHMTFDFVDAETGESISLSFTGAGEDSGDKAIYKAITGCQKYMLLKMFLIPTGDDPEAVKPKTAPAKAPVRPAAPPATPPRPTETAPPPPERVIPIGVGRRGFFVALTEAVGLGLYSNECLGRSDASSEARRKVRAELGCADPQTDGEWAALTSAMRRVVLENTPPLPEQ